MTGVLDIYRLVSEIDRAARRAEQQRALRRWAPWTTGPIPPGSIGGGGWASQFTTAAQNGIFSVLMRDLPDGATHAMISNLPWTAPPTWAEKQRIKDTLFGARWAVECFPPRSALIDGADAFHLFVLPPGEGFRYDLTSR